MFLLLPDIRKADWYRTKTKILLNQIVYKNSFDSYGNKVTGNCD